VCNSEQRRELVGSYTDRVIGSPPDASRQVERLEQRIEQYRQEQRRQRLERAIKLWRLSTPRLPPERFH
jgi:hypothetical protein